jgi:hypothetical protein
MVAVPGAPKGIPARSTSEATLGNLEIADYRDHGRDAHAT